MPNCAGPTCKIVQTPATRPADVPQQAILLEYLKTAEREMQRRGLLKQRGSFNPLWFLGETERNVFLWLNGLSLQDADEFQFWIDIPALIAKRVKQLERYNKDNPFLNPLWGSPACDGESAAEETEYLTMMLELFSPILLHAHALSYVGELLLDKHMNEKTVVILPAPHLKVAKAGQDPNLEVQRTTASPEDRRRMPQRDEAR